MGLLTAVCFGVNSILISKAMVYMPALEGNLICATVNTAIFAVLTAALALGGTMPHLTSLGIVYFAAAALGSAVIGRTTSFISIGFLGPARASQLTAIQPLFSLVLSLAFLQENLTIPKYLGILLVVIGALVLTQDIVGKKAPGNPEEKGSRIRGAGGGRRGWWGILIALLSALSYSFANVFRKLGLAEIPSPYIGAFASSLLSLLVLCSYAYGRSGISGITCIAGYPRQAVKYYAYSGLVTAVAWLAIFTGLTFSSVAVMAALKAISPLFVILLSLIFLKGREKINQRVAVSGLILVIGTFMLIVI